MTDETKIENGIEWWAGEDADGAELDRCSCARCGSSAEFAMCGRCGGDGFLGPDESSDWQDDLYNDAEDRRCPDCRGECGSWHCISTPEHCQSHPIAGREHIESTALSSDAWRDCA